MKFEEPTILFKTIIGSYMWNQQHEGSDTDYFKVYVFDSRSFLLGNRHSGGHHSEDKEKNEEIVSYEIGHVIRELQKGNVNFLWGVLSPKLVFARDEYIELVKIVFNNLSKNCIHSIRGFAMHNLWHWYGLKLDKKINIDNETVYYIKKTKEARLTSDKKKYWKILNTCVRTIDFGIKLLRDRKIDFIAHQSVINVQEIITLLGELEQAYKESELPEKTNNEPFEKFLLNLRLNNLKKEGLI